MKETQRKRARDVTLDKDAPDRRSKKKSLLYSSRDSRRSGVTVTSNLDNNEQDKEDTLQDDKDDSNINLENDTLFTLMYLKGFLINSHLPPIIFLCQLYVILKHRTQVDREIEILRQQKRIVKFQFDHGGHSIAFMIFEDYANLLETESHTETDVFHRFHRYLLSQNIEPTMNLVSMSRDMTIHDKEVTTLMNRGFLTMRDETSFWLSVPNIGTLMSQLTRFKEELVRYVRRKPFYEILDRDILTKTFKRLFLDIRYVLFYMEGIGIFETSSSPSGTLYRLKIS